MLALASFVEVNAMNSATHVSLLRRLRTSPGDPDAWSEFVDRYGRKIYRWCLQRHLQSADAEDVTQIVLMKLAQQMQTFHYDPSKSFRAWLKTVTHHAWQDYIAGVRLGQQGTGDSQRMRLLESQAAPEDLDSFLDEEHQQTLLDEALARVQLRVETKTWDAFHLLVYEHKSGKEVSERLAMPMTAAFMAKSRIQGMLREEVRRLMGPNTEH
jgi:RNA polymerase sigma factor (sigma-70 family)